MAIYNNTRIVLRHLLMILMHDYLIGTVTSPGSGTIVVATTHWEKADDYFNDFIEVFDYSGTGVGTSGKPTDWVNSTHTLTFKPAATLTATDLVEMHRTYSVEELNKAINHAIDQVAQDAGLDRVDETTSLVTSTYQYDIPTNFLYIDNIWVSDSSGNYVNPDPIDWKYWKPVKKSTIIIEFIPKYYAPVTGRTLRIVGTASPSILDTDTEECPVDPEYIIQAAAALLHQSRIRGPDKDSEWHATQMGVCQTKADNRRKEMSTNRSGRAIVEV